MIKKMYPFIMPEVVNKDGIEFRTSINNFKTTQIEYIRT